MYKDAVNYYDNGKWNSIDNTFTDSKDSLENTNNDLKVKLPKSIDDNKKINIKNKDYSISIQMLNIDKSKGEVLSSSNGSSITDVKNSSSVIYKNINPNVDLQLNVLGEKLKENIIVNQYKENLQFNYIIDCKNLSPVENQDGISFYDNQNHVVFTLDKYMMYDANKNTSYNINVQLTKISEGEYQLTITPDNNWLANASYPVIIDPTITNDSTINDLKNLIQSIDDTYVYEFSPSTNYSDSTIMNIEGHITGMRDEGLIKFELPSILQNKIITYSYMELFSTSTKTTGQQINVYANTSDFDVNTVSWNTKPNYDNTVIDYHIIDDNNMYKFDITKMVQRWLTVKDSNYGMTIKANADYGGFNSVYSLNYTDKASRPFISIGFADRSGLKDYWTYHSQNLGEAGTGYVSDYSGNLSIVRNDYIGSSQLMTFNLSFIYNDAERYNIGFGNGWRTNYNFDLISINSKETEYGLIGPDRSTIYYTKKSCAELTGNDISSSTKCYLAEDGSGNIMIHDAGWNIYTKDHMQLNFNKDMQLALIINLKTSQFIQFTYSDYQLNNISDDSGNHIDFKYSNSILQEADIYLKDNQNGTSKKVEWLYYYYDSLGNISTIIHHYDYNSDQSVSDKRIDYTYSTNSIIMSDPSSHDTLKYTFDNNHRVGNISYYNVIKSTTKLYGKIDILYEYNKTTYTDQDGKSTRYTFDNYGHTINIVDDKGNALYYDYYNPYDESTGVYNYEMVNKLKDSSLPQKSQLNPIDNHSFEYTESFTDGTGWYEDIPDSSDGSIGIEYTNDLYGEKSLYINRTNYDGGSPVTLKQQIKLDKGYYTISGFIRNSGSGNGGAYIDIDGASIKGKINGISGKDEWQKYSLSFTVDSDNTLVTIKLENFSISKAYFDNIQLNEGFVDARYNLLENSSFEDSTIGWTLNNASTVDVQTSSQATGDWVAEDGYYVAQLTSALPNSKGLNSLSGTDIQDYNLSFNVPIAVTNSDNVFVYFHDLDGDGDTNWHKLSDYFTGTNEFTGYFYLQEYNQTSSTSFDFSLYAKGSDNDVYIGDVENESGLDAHFGLRYNPITYDISPIIGDHAIKIVGSATTEKTISQTITDSFTSNKTILVGGWAKADAVPNTQDDGRKFEIKLDVTYRDEYSDSQTIPYYIPFNSDTNDWQYVMQKVVIPDNIINMKYSIVYQGTGTAYFDGLQLYVDEFGTSYTYTGNGNMDTINTPTSTNDIKLHYKDKYSNDIDGYWDDKNHYIEVNSNSNGLVNSITEKTYNDKDIISTMSYSYNDKNQVTSMTVGDVNAQYFTTKVSYTSDNQYISSITDEFNNTSTLSYDYLTGLLQSATDPEGKTTLFEYNNDGQLVTVTKDTSNIIYQYTNNKLTQITENGTTYVIEYNEIGQVDKISIGDDDIMSYAYLEDKRDDGTVYYTDLISKQTFNANSYYDFHYDDEYHLTDVLYDGTKEYSYEYDQFGRMTVYTDLVNNKTYIYQYDLTGRVREITDEKGNYTSYNYDDKGNYTETIHNVDGNTQDLRYNYDPDTNFYTGLIYSGENIHENYLYHDYQNDALSRLYEIDLFTGNSTIKKSINYDDQTVSRYGNGNATLRILSIEYTNDNNNSDWNQIKYEYQYDKDGNITYITTYHDSYTYEKYHYLYDSLNQLVREDHWSHRGLYTMVYGYDNYGNVLTKTKYSYQPNTPTANLSGGTIIDSFQYNSAVGWQDQLTSVGNTSIQYDNSGNPSYIGPVDKDQFNFDGLDTITSATVEMDLNWEGRQLSHIDFYGDKSYTGFDYYYNDQGIRTKKVIDGKTTEYYLDGDKVIYEFSGSDTIRYTYDLDGSIISMNLNGTEYFYIKDLQGSITDIVDKDGNVIVSYEYDAYGNILSIADTSGTNINLGIKNPYRYRGYRYDEETGWYYLNSRYYSPQWGRFISEDGQINNGVLGTNMYDYSVNNPVNYKDPGGNECYFAQGDIETGWAKEGECGGRFGENLDAKTINDVSNTGINSGKGTVNPSASFANSYGAYTVGTEQTRVPNEFKRSGNSVDSFIKNNVNPNFQQNVKKAFGSDAKVTTLTQDVTVYRYSGGTSSGKSYWYTPNLTLNPSADLALPSGNTYQFVNTYTIPKGTIILEGTVAPNFGQPGGGYQYYVPNPSVVIPK